MNDRIRSVTITSAFPMSCRRCKGKEAHGKVVLYGVRLEVPSDDSVCRERGSPHARKARHLPRTTCAPGRSGSAPRAGLAGDPAHARRVSARSFRRRRPEALAPAPPPRRLGGACGAGPARRRDTSALPPPPPPPPPLLLLQPARPPLPGRVRAAPAAPGASSCAAPRPSRPAAARVHPAAMATRSCREKAQKLNEQHQLILSKLLREEDNKYCADCEAKGSAARPSGRGSGVPCSRRAGAGRPAGAAAGGAAGRAASSVRALRGWAAAAAPGRRPVLGAALGWSSRRSSRHSSPGARSARQLGKGLKLGVRAVFQPGFWPE